MVTESDDIKLPILKKKTVFSINGLFCMLPHLPLLIGNLEAGKRSAAAAILSPWVGPFLNACCTRTWDTNGTH